MTFTHTRPTGPQEKDMIPRALLVGMAALALSSLSIATYGVVTGRPPAGIPADAPVLAERLIVLEGQGAKAVKVLAPDGAVLADMDHGGFVAVIQNGLERARHVAGIVDNKPVRLVSFANGRLSIIDPETGWSAELGAFGDDNRAAFERLIDN